VGGLGPGHGDDIRGVRGSDSEYDKLKKLIEDENENENKMSKLNQINISQIMPLSSEKNKEFASIGASIVWLLQNVVFTGSLQEQPIKKIVNTLNDERSLQVAMRDFKDLIQRSIQTTDDNKSLYISIAHLAKISSIGPNKLEEWIQPIPIERDREY
jgi:hypothetical protein